MTLGRRLFQEERAYSKTISSSFGLGSSRLLIYFSFVLLDFATCFCLMRFRKTNLRKKNDFFGYRAVDFPYSAPMPIQDPDQLSLVRFFRGMGMICLAKRTTRLFSNWRGELQEDHETYKAAFNRSNAS